MTRGTRLRDGGREAFRTSGLIRCSGSEGPFVLDASPEELAGIRDVTPRVASLVLPGEEMAPGLQWMS